MKKHVSTPLSHAPLPDPRHGSRLTEQRNPASREIDRMSPADALATMQTADREALAAVERVNEELTQLGLRTAARLDVRIGMHSGPVVGGVIGTRRIAYDLWGDTVNTASRMESHGVAGKIHVAEPMRRALEDRFEFAVRGKVAIKGLGLMRTYFLIGRKPAPAT